MALNFDQLLQTYGPAVWWKLADSTGSTSAIDSGPSGFTGTTQGTLTYAQVGPIPSIQSDTAALFDGSTAAITSLFFVNSPHGFTVAAWVNPSSGSSFDTIAASDNNSGTGFRLYTNSGLPGFSVQGHSAAANGTVALPLNQWSFIVGTWDGKTVNVYVNGALAGTSAFSATILADVDSVGIGAWVGFGFHWPGDIAQVAVFDSVLTAAQILALYTSALASPLPAPTTMPSASPFSFLFYDFLTADFLGALPLAGVTWGQTLNTAGTLQGTINMADPRVQAMNPAFLTAPGRTMCVVDYNGSVVWAGWSMTSRPFTRSTRILSYTATELWSYLGRRMQATDYSSPPYSGITGLGSTMSIWAAAFTSVTNNSSTVQTGWDPLLIGAQVINDVLGFSNTVPILNGNPVGGMQLMLNGTALSAGAPTAYLASGSGTPVSDYININFPYTSFQKCDAILSQLMGLGYGVGFDAGVDTAYQAGRGTPITSTINLSYPRRGRTFAQNNVVVQVAGSARDYTVTPDASTMANTLYEIGGQNAAVISQNINPLEQGYALFEDSQSRSQIQSANIIQMLTQLGFGDLFLTSYPPVTFTVKVPLFGEDPTFGNFTIGDDCRLLIDPDELFTSGLDGEWRIIAYTVNLPDQGDATIDLTLAPPPVYPAGAYI